MNEAINQVTIVGTIVESKLTHDTYNGKNVIKGDFIVSVNEGDKGTSLIPINCYSNQITKAGASSKQYEALDAIVIGSRVSVSASLSEGKMWDSGRSSLNKFTRIRFGFINTPRDGEEDGATFKISGFIVEEIKPIYTASDADNPADYVFSVGQPNYLGTKAEVFKFNVDPKETSKIEKLAEIYPKGETVSIIGKLDFDVETDQIVKEGFFGDETVDIQRKIKRYVFVNGLPVLPNLCYSKEDMDTLIAGTLADDNAEEAKAKNKSNGASPAIKQTVTNKTTTKALI